MHKALHPRDDTDRLYESKKGGRGLASIEDSIDALTRQLEYCIKKSKGRLITVNTNNKRINRIITRK